jgi:hypothetical protein
MVIQSGGQDSKESLEIKTACKEGTVKKTVETSMKNGFRRK